MSKKWKRHDKVMFECYQIAGSLLLTQGYHTTGQHQRLTELLLNILSEPDRYSPRLIRDLRRMALEP